MDAIANFSVEIMFPDPDFWGTVVHHNKLGTISLYSMLDSSCTCIQAYM